MRHLPHTGFLTLSQIIGQEAVTEEQAKANRIAGKGPKRPRPEIPALIPVKKSNWWAGVKSGRYPERKKIPGGRGAFWRVEDILDLIERTGGNNEQ